MSHFLSPTSLNQTVFPRAEMTHFPNSNGSKLRRLHYGGAVSQGGRYSGWNKKYRSYLKMKERYLKAMKIN